MSNKQTLSAHAVLSWGICTIFFLYEFFLRTVIGTFQHPIMYDLQLSSTKFSLLSTSFYLIVYCIMQIPAGLIISRFGIKTALLVGVFTCSISAIVFAFAQSYPTAVFARILMGFGSSFGFICMLCAVYEWLPQNKIGLCIGISQFIGTMGPILAAGPIEQLSTTLAISWRNFFLIIGGLGFVLFIISIFGIHKKKVMTGDYVILQRASSYTALKVTLAKNKQPIMIAIFCASIYFTIEYLSENHGKSILLAKGINGTTAAYMITIAWLGYACGGPLLGWLSDYLERRKIILQAASVIFSISILMMHYSVTPIYLFIAFTLLGIAASSQTVGFVTIAEQFKKPFIPIGLSMNNAMITGFAAINAPLISLMLENQNSASTTNLTSEQLTTVFAIFYVLACITLFIATSNIRETFCKSQVDFTIVSTH